MKKAKTALLLVFCITISTFFSGCSLFFSGDELLTPPMPGGEMSQIRIMLDELVGQKYTLKYPTSGEFRSAIVRYDINGNGHKDAVAFFSTEKENISSMHIALLTLKDGEWTAVKDVSVLASGVEKLEFDDFDGDGVSEIIVGWSIYGAEDKQVAVYSFKNGVLTPRLQEPYTEFLTCDLNTDNKKELLVLQQMATEKRGTVKLLSLTEDGINEISSVAIDSKATAVVSLCESKLLNGKPAVYIDMQKGTKMSTDIIFLSNGRLQNPLYDKEQKTTLLTERNSAVTVRDINCDGTPDIPMLEVLPDYKEKSEKEKLYITRWCCFDGEKLVVALSAYMNYTDGYYFDIPNSLDGKMTVTKNTESRIRTFYFYNSETNRRTEELFSVMTVSENKWISSFKENGKWNEIATVNGLVYAVSINEKNTLGLKTEEIKKTVKIIEQESESNEKDFDSRG